MADRDYGRRRIEPHIRGCTFSGSDLPLGFESGEDCGRSGAGRECEQYRSGHSRCAH